MSKGKLAIIAILFFVGVFAFFPFFSVLTLVDAKRNVPVLIFRVSDGQEFVISFTHSVNKRPVRDYIRVEGDHFVIVKSEYDAFGAGMPETSVDGATVRLREGGKVEFSGINRRMPAVTLFVGTIAEHYLDIGGTSVRLADIVAPGTPVRFEITKVSGLNLLKK